jgi:hypothetical protein
MKNPLSCPFHPLHKTSHATDILVIKGDIMLMNLYRLVVMSTYGVLYYLSLLLHNFSTALVDSSTHIAILPCTANQSDCFSMTTLFSKTYEATHHEDR